MDRLFGWNIFITLGILYGAGGLIRCLDLCASMALFQYASIEVACSARRQEGKINLNYVSSCSEKSRTELRLLALNVELIV